jgi:hypothetical protein
LAAWTGDTNISPCPMEIFAISIGEEYPTVFGIFPDGSSIP